MEFDFLKMAKAMKSELIGIRRDFHMNPELDYELYRTQGKIKQFLDAEGIQYVEAAGSGICATIHGNGTKTIGLRADMDALPLQDMKKCDYASKVKGKMHACGHDAHTTILLGVSRILNGIKDSLKGNVKLFFEPAEETTGGSKVMIEEGVLENPHVDRIIGLHVEEGIETGKIGVRYGVVNAASNPFTIKINGKGSHGARPHAGIDPVVISSYVVIALQEIISREISPTEGALITVGSINGGTAQNIIPSEVTISGIIRTMKTENREYVKKRLREVVEGVVSSMRGTCSIEIEESYPCLYNDNNVIRDVVSSASGIIGEKNIINLENPSMGVESFAYFSMERPSAFYYLGSGNKSKNTVYPAHGNLFDIDEECIPIGTAIQCKAVYDFLR